MKRILSAGLVLLAALALAQNKTPNPSVVLWVQPENARVTGFDITSQVFPDEAEFLGHEVWVEFKDRSGTLRRERISWGNTLMVVKGWKLTILRQGNIESKLASMKYKGYTLKDNTVHSTGEIYPGIYTFIAYAFFRYDTGRRDEEGNPIYAYISREARVIRPSIYAGVTDSRTMRDIFYYSQRLFMVKGILELGGTIDGPYSDSFLYKERPWIGAIFHGFEGGSILSKYFEEHGVRGYLANNQDYPPKCNFICPALEAYDPDWLLGRDRDASVRQAQDFLGQFLARLVGNFEGGAGFYGYRGFSRAFDMGDYDPKGFIMFSTPHRDYFFFSGSGKFRDSEPILVIELLPGVVATMRTVMMWGDLKKRLPECTGQGCPRGPSNR